MRSSPTRGSLPHTAARSLSLLRTRTASSAWGTCGACASASEKTATERRSQAANRRVALERMAEKIAESRRVEKPRRPTRPSRAKKEARLAEKKHRSDIKRSRRTDED